MCSHLIEEFMWRLKLNVGYNHLFVCPKFQIKTCGDRSCTNPSYKHELQIRIQSCHRFWPFFTSMRHQFCRFCWRVLIHFWSMTFSQWLFWTIFRHFQTLFWRDLTIALDYFWQYLTIWFIQLLRIWNYLFYSCFDGINAH